MWPRVGHIKKHPDFVQIYDVLSFERHEEVGKLVFSRCVEKTIGHVSLLGISALTSRRLCGKETAGKAGIVSKNI